MKRILIATFLILLAYSVSACSPNNETLGLVENHTFDEEEIDYEIEKILFSKSFQSTEPTVELISKNNRLRVMASLGLSEYSSVNVNNVVKKGNEVNIHVSGISKKRNMRLAVPQIIMEFKKIKATSIDELQFNIVYDDYTPLKVKFSINDLLNIVQSHFKVSLKSMPEYSLEKMDDGIVWNINYSSVFDRNHPGTPLVNLSAKIDANNGNILTSEKTFISSLLDNGHVINYFSDKKLLYKKTIQEEDKNKPEEQLWSYDIESKKKTLVFSSNHNIALGEFSHDLNYIAILETSEDNSDLFIVSMDDLRTYKIFNEEKFNIDLVRWAENNILYLLDRGVQSKIYSYNMEDHEISFVKSLDKIIDNLVIAEDGFLLIEENKDNINKKLSFTSNWENFRDIGYGFKPRFIDEDLISFLQEDDKLDNNSLIIYNLRDRAVLNKIDDNIVNYQITSNNNILYIKKDIHKQFELIKYNMEEDSTRLITSLIDNNIYYSGVNNTAYLNIVLPFEDEKTEVIYAIDLSKLN